MSARYSYNGGTSKNFHGAGLLRIAPQGFLQSMAFSCGTLPPEYTLPGQKLPPTGLDIWMVPFALVNELQQRFYPIFDFSFSLQIYYAFSRD
jgi:hypothetical protein